VVSPAPYPRYLLIFPILSVEVSNSETREVATGHLIIFAIDNGKLSFGRLILKIKKVYHVQKVFVRFAGGQETSSAQFLCSFSFTRADMERERPTMLKSEAHVQAYMSSMILATGVNKTKVIMRPPPHYREILNRQSPVVFKRWLTRVMILQLEIKADCLRATTSWRT